MAPARRPAEGGQATLELVLCLPLLFLVLGTLIECAGLMTDQIRLWHSAREAVRTAAVEQETDEVATAARRGGLDPSVTVAPDAAYRRLGQPVTVVLRYRPRGRLPFASALLSGVVLEAKASMRIERP